eukprot:1914984-Amphidinium_carterae.1
MPFPPLCNPRIGSRDTPCCIGRPSMTCLTCVTGSCTRELIQMPEMQRAGLQWTLPRLPAKQIVGN